MKTSIKILLLILGIFVAVSGVVVYAKTRVAPPSNIKPVDQYTLSIAHDADTMANASSFAEARRLYIRYDDKVRRYVYESVIENKPADEYRKQIDEAYGKQLTDYGFNLFNSHVWPDQDVRNLLDMLNELEIDRTSDGDKAATEEFFSSSNELKGIVNDYKAALTLSRNTGYTNPTDVQTRISKSSSYRNHPYLKNNQALQQALQSLPSKIAQSHYNYLSRMLSQIANYRQMDESTFDVITNRMKQSLQDYKSINYGSGRPSVSAMESRINSICDAAGPYYAERSR